MKSIIVKVGIRKFREHLPHYLLTTSPVTITRHGEIIGLYIPVNPSPEKVKWDSLREAALRLEQFLKDSNVSEDELVAKFKNLRKKK